MVTRRELLRLIGLGTATSVLVSCAPPPETSPTLIPSPEPSQTPEPIPTTTPEIVAAITKELWRETVTSRTEFWSSELGAKLYKLAHYEELAPDPIERSIMLEPLINHRVIHIFIGGFEGQGADPITGKGARTKDWGQMNCDAPISLFFNLDTCQTTVIPWDRDMPLGRGSDHTSDGDVMLRLAHTQSTEKETSKYLVLDAATPEENITNNIAILTGTKPDYMINTNMDGYKMILDAINLLSSSESDEATDPVEALKEIRNRRDKDAGERGLVAVQGAIKLVKKFLGDGHSLSSILQVGNVGISATNLTGDTMIGSTGNPFSKIKSPLDELDLSVEKQAMVANTLMDKIIYLRFTLSKLKPDLANSFYYSEATLRKVIKEQLQDRVRNPNNPDDHDYPILFREDGRSGHNLNCPIEMYRHAGIYVYDQHLNEGVTTITEDPITKKASPPQDYNYETILTNEEELLRLKRYYSVIRYVMGKYIEPAFTLGNLLHLMAYRTFLQSV